MQRQDEGVLQFFFNVFFIPVMSSICVFYLIGNKTWIRLQARSQVHETGRHFELIFFLCVNVENRLRCSRRTKFDLGRGCLIRVGGRGFCYTRKIRHSQY